jgi:hypothetical protein
MRSQEKLYTPFFVLMLGAAAGTLALGALARRRSRSLPLAAPSSQSAPDLGPVAELRIRRTLQYFVVPVWLAAGTADWWFHRKSDVEHTGGLKETALHLAMLAETGIPVVAALFLEIDPIVLAGMIAAFFLHEATAMWDVRYAVKVREVTPLEQHAHSFLELIPLMAVVLISVLHAKQLKALAGLEVAPAQPLRWKAKPLPRGYVAGALGLMTLFEILPYLEELARDWRFAPTTTATAASTPGIRDSRTEESHHG